MADRACARTGTCSGRWRRRPARGRVARVVAHRRGPQARAQPPRQPLARAALALLPAGARARRTTSRAEWLLELWEHGADAGQGGARARDRPSPACSSATASAASTRPRCSACCASRRSRSPPAPSRRPPPTSQAVAARLRLVNRQLTRRPRPARRPLDQLAAAGARAGAAPEQRDATILASLPGRRQDRPRHAARRGLRSPAAPRLPRLALPRGRRASHQAAAARAASSCMRQACHAPPAQRRLPLGPRRQSSATPQPRQIRRTAEAAATPTAAPCDRSPTGSSRSPAPCSGAGRRSTPAASPCVPPSRDRPGHHPADSALAEWWSPPPTS